ncbi:50S ribosomal protein L6 [Candidatus Rariloculus sp.]|uniref:50S ribosomal protein L6 n=1 Tax=Candidatus Rariloculus sp. TaxID=3101265 RepID=UPI003D14150E
MSRIAKRPVDLVKDTTAEIEGQALTVKGPKGSLALDINREVEVKHQGGSLSVAARSGSRFANAVAGTTRALIANMVTGVSAGFERKLQLVGVGYRAQAKEGKITLSLGFSHPVEYVAPDGVTVETPSLTEILVKGIDRQRVGQVAAELRGFRPPEPYKGKGVRYSDERIVLREAKKK